MINQSICSAHISLFHVIKKGNHSFFFAHSRLEMELERDKRERDARERELRERELRDMEMREKMKAELDMKPPGMPPSSKPGNVNYLFSQVF